MGFLHCRSRLIKTVNEKLPFFKEKQYNCFPFMSTVPSSPDGNFSLQPQVGQLNDSSSEIILDFVYEARDIWLQSAVNVIKASLVVHLVELFARNKSKIENTTNVKLNIRERAQEVANFFLPEIKDEAVAILKESNGVSLQVDAEAHVSKYVNEVRKRLRLPDETTGS